VIAAALALLTFGASACGSDSKTASPAAATVQAPVGGDAGQVASANTGAETAMTPADTAALAPEAPSEIANAPLETVPDSPYLAIDVSVGLEVSDMKAANVAVEGFAVRHGGKIFERSVSLSDDPSSTSSWVIKLPPTEIQPAIADLDSIGTQRSASQGTEDLTNQVVDLDARLLSAQASLDRIRTLLESAKDLGEIISLESQLTQRETVVEQLVAQKRAISDRTALATLRLQVSLAPVESRTTTAVADKPAAKASIGTAFKSGWKGFVNVLVAVMIFIGYTAPFLVVVALGAMVLIPVTRRRRSAQRNRSAAPPLLPTPDAGQQTTERGSVGAARSQ
jgi:hypothetical protein